VPTSAPTSADQVDRETNCANDPDAIRMRCTHVCCEKSGRGQVPGMSAQLEVGSIVKISGLNALGEFNGFHGQIVDFNGIRYGVRVFTKDRRPIQDLLPERITLVLPARDYPGPRASLSKSLCHATSR